MMRRSAVDIYAKLFAKEDFDFDMTCELFNDLPTLNEEDSLSLDLDITFEEVTDAVK